VFFLDILFHRMSANASLEQLCGILGSAGEQISHSTVSWL